MNRINEKSYIITVTCNAESTSISAIVYNIETKNDVFFADLKLEITNVEVSRYSVPSDRQANTKEELYTNNNPSIEINETRNNDIEQLAKKLKEIFGISCNINIANRN